MEKKVILDILKKSIHTLLETYECEELKIIKDSRPTQSLCSAIEAMFLHGEIHSHSTSILSRFGRTKQCYEYNFWDFVSKFIPRDLIRVLENHNLKLTHIGLSRVWLRYTLNESTILSYLESMIKDDKILKQFYSKESLIRDEELMGAFCGLLKSIEHLVFELDVSLPLLNTWVNSDALKISGLQHHVSSTESDYDKYMSINNVTPEISTIGNQDLSIISCNDEEIVPTNINVLKDSISNYPLVHEALENLTKNDDVIKLVTKEDIKCNAEEDLASLGNICNIKEEIFTNDSIEEVAHERNDHSDYDIGLSNTFIDDGLHNTEVMDSSLGEVDLFSNAIKEDFFENKAVQYPFDQLWHQCQTGDLKLIEEIQVTNEVNLPEPYSRVNSHTNKPSDELDSPKETDQSWVFIGDELLSRNTELKKLMDIFPGVNQSSSQFSGNSVFGGRCQKCRILLETNKLFLDYYDGQLYCIDCESKVKAIIPRAVITNWDFIPRSVSETTKKFLSEIIVHPNINLATNPCLFEAVPELARVRKLRHKLCLLWLQVTSCDIDISTKMRQSMFPREYMLASVQEKDLYSLEDLIILQNGILERSLLYAIDKIAVPHIKKCSVCRLKALPCDECLDENNLIFIHEIENYYECSTKLCQAVIHIQCKKSTSKSFYCRRCMHYLEKQEPITLDSYDTADMSYYAI